MQTASYDYIFLGAGCASLSIVMRMIGSPEFENKKILLVDKDLKAKNDRTWCFWEKDPGFFEEIVFRQWSNLLFKADKTIPLDIDPYKYKMIRGIDFYQYCFSKVRSRKNIDFVTGTVSSSGGAASEIYIDGERCKLSDKALVFNSIFEKPKKQDEKFYLLQHFKGWIIETPGQSFNAEEATLMDFRVNQENGTTFVYVLPLSPTTALVEYTLFSESILPAAEYDAALENYVKAFLNIIEYNIVEREFGVIPMTNARFPTKEKGVYHIGTAGGQTKASTGYTFKFIQKQAASIVKQLSNEIGYPLISESPKRFQFYDSTLLHILSRKLLPGKKIFSALFEKNRAATVLKFLDNETSVAEEIGLINTLPKKVFLRAGFREIMKMLF